LEICTSGFTLRRAQRCCKNGRFSHVDCMDPVLLLHFF
jgi:hypothetical protein